MDKVITLAVSINISLLGKVRGKIYNPELDPTGPGPATVIM
jgi:hypothetical protein